MRYSFIIFLLALLSVFPISAQTTLPPDTPTITAENAQQLQPITRLGYGLMLDMGLVDGPVLAVTTSGGVVLYNANDLNAEATFIPYQADPFPAGTLGNAGADFTDSTVVIYGTQGVVALDVATGTQRGLFPAYNGEVVAMSQTRDLQVIHPDPRESRLSLQDGSGYELAILGVDSSPRVTVDGVFREDGTRLYLAVVSEQPTLQVWDSDESSATFGELLNTIDLSRQSGLPQVVLSDMRVAVRLGTEIIVFDRETLEEQRRLPGQTALALSPAGDLLAAVSPDGPVMLYDLATGEARPLSDATCPQPPTHLLFSADGRTLYTASSQISGTVAAWDTATGTQIGAAGGYSPLMTDMAVRTDENGETLVYVTTTDPRIMPCSTPTPGTGLHVYSLTSGQWVDYIEHGAAYSTGVGPTGDVLMGTRGGVVLIPADSSDIVVLADDLDAVVRDVTFSETGEWLAAAAYGDDALVRVWAAATLEETITLPAQVAFWGDSLAFTERGLIYVDDGFVRVVDLETQEEVLALEHRFQVEGIAYHAESGRLATTAYDSSTRETELFLWDLTQAEPVPIPLMTFPVEPLRSRLAFSPDGRLLLASAPNGDLAGPETFIYDTQSGEMIHSLDLPLPLMFHSSGRFIIAYNQRNELEVWAAPTE